MPCFVLWLCDPPPNGHAVPRESHSGQAAAKNAAWWRVHETPLGNTLCNGRGSVRTEQGPRLMQRGAQSRRRRLPRGALGLCLTLPSAWSLSEQVCTLCVNTGEGGEYMQL